jgi:uncharacterized protein YdhG (YjbR/CyaY superfamily)
VASFQSVDEYIASQPESSQGALVRVREAIRKALPRAEEVISYNMPTYKIDGDTVLQFAAWKSHYSLYAASEPILREFEDELRAYTIEKGTIRFPLSEPVPEDLIGRIAAFRARRA